MRPDEVMRGAAGSLVLDPKHVFSGLLFPARYKVMYGGRGSAKSHSFAEALIRLAAVLRLRILCTREVQNSIADSVHRLLQDKIEALGYSDRFDVTQNAITSASGSLFIFRGLRHSVREIKSLEAIDICWVEEAQGTSEDSWRVLIPTIRADGSEIWVTFNPEDETDPTYQRFVINRVPNSFVRRVNYDQNPHFPDTLRREMEYMRRVDYEAYLNVWEGIPRTRSKACILAGKYVVDSFTPPDGTDPMRPLWNGPYYGVDWGFSQDPTAMVRMWVEVATRTLYIEHEAYGVGVEIDKLAELFDRSVPGGRTHVSRADNARPETISYLRRNGYPRMAPCDKWTGSVEDGIEHLKGYARIVIHPRCKHAADEARLYSYKVDKLTGDVLPDIVDKHNHCWDAVRYGLGPLIARRTQTQSQYVNIMGR